MSEWTIWSWHSLRVLCCVGTVLLVAASGANAQKTLVASPSGDFAFDPDLDDEARTLSFSVGGVIHLARPDGRAIVVLPVQGFPVKGQSLSGDGRRMAFSPNGTLLYGFDLDTMTSQVLDAPIGTAWNQISGDGSRILYEKENVQTIPFLGGSPVEIFTRSESDTGGFSITWDGALVAYTNVVCVPQPNCVFSRQVFLADTAGIGYTQVTFEAGVEHERARVSSDASVICFQRFETGHYPDLQSRSRFRSTTIAATSDVTASM